MSLFFNCPRSDLCANDLGGHLKVLGRDVGLVSAGVVPLCLLGHKLVRLVAGFYFISFIYLFSVCKGIFLSP